MCPDRMVKKTKTYDLSLVIFEEAPDVIDRCVMLAYT